MKKSAIRTLVAIAVLSSSTFNVNAQNNEVNYDSKPLYVDGELSKGEVTDSELNYIENELEKQSDQIELNKKKTTKYKKLQNSTEKLADVTEDYVEEKQESEKIINEYNTKIKCLLDANNRDPNCDKYRKNKAPVEPVIAPVVQKPIEPVQKVEEVVIEEKPQTFMDSIRMNIGLGTSTYNDDGNLQNIRSNMGFSLSVESKFSELFNLGVRLNYATIDINDIQVYAPDFNASPYYNNGYFNFYGPTGREIIVTNWGVDLYTKMYLTRSNRLQPYVGFGLGVNSLTLKYTNNNAYNYQVYQFGTNESHQLTYFDGSLRLGADLLFNESIGMGLSVGLKKGLMDFGQQESPFNQIDLIRLEQLGEQFAQAYAYDLAIGLTYSF
jgi:hypothetical protein